MGRHSSTKVWEYFDYISDRLAECQTCKARLSTPQNGTYNLKRHLFTMHGINTYLKGTFKDKTLTKNGTYSGRWKYKKIVIPSDKSHAVNSNKEQKNLDGKEVENVSRNSISDEANNESVVTEEEENNSIASFNLTIRDSLPDNKIYKIDPENDCDDIKNFQDDPLSKSNLAISSVYSTTNAQRNTSPTPIATIESPTSNIELEKLKAEALAAKLKAEARYFNELADLTRSKRVYVDLQCQQLRRQFKKS
ncbi:hypothetical protein DOY81_000855 [Sarcophaga bullata]|nr:hypothetical protein DOY81_000855 [Sarcophaga bullata]